MHRTQMLPERTAAAQAPELRPGLNPLVLTRSVIVGYHLQLEGQARPLWPVRADQAESGSGPGVTGSRSHGQWPRAGPLAASESGLLTARHRQVPLLRQMQGNAGVELPHKSPASFNMKERSSPRVTQA